MAWRPRRRYTKPAMLSHTRRDADGRAHHGPQLVERKPAQHRHDAIVPAYWVKSERPRSKPDAGSGKPATANVADDDAAARHAIELAQERHPVVTAEVMQELRAEHDVESTGGD